jgi:hypothetical protein
MKARCSKCEIPLRYREIVLCRGLYEDYEIDIQMCSDCLVFD